MFIFNISAEELLVKTSDNILSTSPKEFWSESFFEEEMTSNAKQGYIVSVKPDGSLWGNSEQDPRSFAIVRIPSEDWNKIWIEPEYDYDKPIYNCPAEQLIGCYTEGLSNCDEMCENGTFGGEIVDYQIKVQRAYKLPLESFMTEEEIEQLKSISCDDTNFNSETDWKIFKEIDNIEDLIVPNIWEEKPFDWVRPGDSSCEYYSSLGEWEIIGNAIVGYPQYNGLRQKVLILNEPAVLDSEEVKLEIPSGIQIVSENLYWDGNITLPTSKDSSSTELGLGLEEEIVVEMGFANDKLTFDKAVKITLKGEAGKLVGYNSGDGEFYEIDEVCSENTQENGNNLPAGGDCKIDDGDDLVIWSKHFTDFVTYTSPTMFRPGEAANVAAVGPRVQRCQGVSAHAKLTRRALT